MKHSLLNWMALRLSVLSLLTSVAASVTETATLELVTETCDGLRKCCV
jgi:hypothetical protein